MALDFSHLEKKWQLAWQEKKLFESEPDKRPKFYLTVAYPYPSGAMHVGHVRTYAVPDVIAKFKRMQGYNVLFPMAWHVTGTPIIGALNRLKEGEKKQLHVLKNIFKMTDKELQAIKEPMDFANYFIEKHYKYGMQKLGFSIDWRREFTTNDTHYNKFIEWQFSKLREKGLVKKGKHPVRFCLKSKDPVTAHDLLEGEDADINKYVLVKFKIHHKGKTAVLPAATLRPETVFGVTNIWLNHSSRLVLTEVGKESWIITEQCLEKLRQQGKVVKELEKIDAEKLIGMHAENPATKEKILILPASFVNPDNATGIVMSVPAHAPYDFIALKDLDKGLLSKYGISIDEIRKIKPIKVIDSPGLNVEQEIENNKITKQEDNRLESITKDIYKNEFHHGRLNEKCRPYKGKVSEAKDKIIQDFRKKKVFDEMYDFNKKVVCRDGGKVIVAEKDSWFIDYGNPEWKKAARKALEKMKIIPDYMRPEYENGLNWVEDWPCIRNYGLGTRIPWDKDFIIEPLSDSTIYMAFYTLSHLIKKLKPEQLKKEFFDYIFLSEGDLEKTISVTKIDKKKLKEIKKSFEYWYPLDWNVSAHELIKNHMIFFIFNHSTIFRNKHWPKGEASWGIGLLEGQKMSSSKGNVLLASDAIENFGADTVRLFMLSIVEPWQDFDWRNSEAENFKKRIGWFHDKIVSLYGSGVKKDIENIDLWLLSKLHGIIKDTTEAMENFQTRKAGLKSFFEMSEHIKWYERRGGMINQLVINQVLEDWVKLIAPFIPHTCEELWERMGKDRLVLDSKYPKYEKNLVNKESEFLENILKTLIEDVESVIKITKIKPKKITFFVSQPWKYDLYAELQNELEYINESGKILKTLMQVEQFRPHSKEIMRMLPSIMKSPEKLNVVLDQEKEFSFLSENKGFLEKEFECEIEMIRSQDSNNERAKKAEPGKPGIELL